MHSAPNIVDFITEMAGPDLGGAEGLPPTGGLSPSPSIFKTP